MCMLTREEVIKRTTFSNAQLYRVQGLPQAATLGPNRVAWYRTEISMFLLSCPRAIEHGLTYPGLEVPEDIFVMTEKQVCGYTSLARANLNRMIREARFPSPVKLSVQKIGYLRHEVDHWLQSRPRASWSLGVQPSL